MNHHMTSEGPVPFTDEEEAAWLAHCAEGERQAQIDEIKNRIAQLEIQQTPRRMREAALGIPGAAEFLQMLNLQIADLRSQLNDL